MLERMVMTQCCVLSFRNCGEMSGKDDTSEMASPCAVGSQVSIPLYRHVDVAGARMLLKHCLECGSQGRVFVLAGALDAVFIETF
jgi:hypothetical protein